MKNDYYLCLCRLSSFSARSQTLCPDLRPFESTE